MKRKLSIILLTAMLLQTAAVSGSVSDDLVLTYEGTVMENAYIPYFCDPNNNNIYIQSRLICDKMGWSLSWDGENRTVLIGDAACDFLLDKNIVEICINGNPVLIDSKIAEAVIHNGISYIPLAALQQEMDIVGEISNDGKQIDLTTHVDYIKKHKLTEEELSKALIGYGPYQKKDYQVAADFYYKYEDTINSLIDILFNDWHLDNKTIVLWPDSRLRISTSRPDLIDHEVEEMSTEDIIQRLKNTGAYDKMVELMESEWNARVCYVSYSQYAKSLNIDLWNEEILEEKPSYGKSRFVGISYETDEIYDLSYSNRSYKISTLKDLGGEMDDGFIYYGGFMNLSSY